MSGPSCPMCWRRPADRAEIRRDGGAPGSSPGLEISSLRSPWRNAAQVGMARSVEITRLCKRLGSAAKLALAKDSAEWSPGSLSASTLICGPAQAVAPRSLTREATPASNRLQNLTQGMSRPPSPAVARPSTLAVALLRQARAPWSPEPKSSSEPIRPYQRSHPPPHRGAPEATWAKDLERP